MTSGSAQWQQQQRRRRRRLSLFWSEGEYGEGHWASILRDPKLHFASHRTSTDLRDKWRNIEKAKVNPSMGRRDRTRSSLCYTGVDREEEEEDGSQSPERCDAADGASPLLPNFLLAPDWLHPGIIREMRLGGRKDESGSMSVAMNGANGRLVELKDCEDPEEMLRLVRDFQKRCWETVELLTRQRNLAADAEITLEGLIAERKKDQIQAEKTTTSTKAEKSVKADDGTLAMAGPTGQKGEDTTVTGPARASQKRTTPDKEDRPPRVNEARHSSFTKEERHVIPETHISETHIPETQALKSGTNGSGGCLDPRRDMLLSALRAGRQLARGRPSDLCL